MPIIGNPLNSVAFLTDSFNGNGSTTAFTMSVAPATSSSILVVITGVTQNPTTYSVVGTTLTFSTAPPSGTANISVRYLGIPASGVTTSAYRTLTEFTATASQTTFTPPSYTVGFIAVYQNGVMLGSADYTASNGTTVVLAVGALVNDLISTESFYVSSVLNALPVTGGTIGGNLVVTGTETVGTIISPAALTLKTNNGTTAVTIDTSQNVGIGTSSPGALLHVSNATAKIRIGETASSAYLDISRDSATGYSIYNAAQADPYRGHIWQLGGTEQMRIDTAGLLKFNSGYGSAATAYGCRAWVNFNGTGTVAIRASGNVSSITDNGTGDYTVNFTTAMPDANYATVGISAVAANTGKVIIYSSATAPTVSLVRIYNDIASNLTGQDSSIMNIAIFR